MTTIRSVVWIQNNVARDPMTAGDVATTPVHQVFDNLGTDVTTGGPGPQNCVHIGSGAWRSAAFTPVVGRHYKIIFDGDPNDDNPLSGVDKWKSKDVDGDDAIAALSIATILAKMPTNFVMGSSDQSNKDDEIDAILVDTDTTIPALIAAAESAIRGTDSRDLTELAGAGWVAADNLVQAHNKLDLLQQDIDNFENITRFKVSGLSFGLERPESGTTLHEIYFNLKDDQGLPVNADGGGGGAVTVEATSFGGSAGDRDGRLSATTMTNIATGRYLVTFSVANTDILEGVHFFFSWAESGNANNVDKVAHVVDSNEVGYLASDRTRDDQIALETAAILIDTDTTLPALIATAESNIRGTDSRDLSELAGSGWLAGTDTLEEIRDAVDAITGITPQAVRDAMKLTPSVGAPGVGSVDEHLDDILADTAAGGAGPWTTAIGFATPANVTTAITSIKGTSDLSITDIAGAGFSAVTDTLEAIADAVALIPTTPTGALEFIVEIPTLEKPDTGGSKPYRIFAELRNAAGAFFDPDSDTINVSARNESDASRDSNLSALTLTKNFIGRYEVTYTVDDVHAIEEIIFDFDFAVSAVSQAFEKVETVIDATSDDASLVGGGF